jgi:preprotein translocase subunit SecD
MEDWEDGGTELPGFVQTDDASKKKVEIGATKMVQLLKAAKIISPAASEAMNELLIQLFAAANVLSPSQLRGVQKQIVNMMKNPVKKAATEKQKKAAAKEEPEQDKTIVDPAKSAQGAANAEVDRRVA